MILQNKKFYTETKSLWISKNELPTSQFHNLIDNYSLFDIPI